MGSQMFLLVTVATGGLCLSVPVALAIAFVTHRLKGLTMNALSSCHELYQDRLELDRDRLEWEKRLATPPTDPEAPDVTEAREQIDDWLRDSEDAAGWDENQREDARWCYLVLAGEVEGNITDKKRARSNLERWGAPRPD